MTELARLRALALAVYEFDLRAPLPGGEDAHRARFALRDALFAAVGGFAGMHALREQFMEAKP